MTLLLDIDGVLIGWYQNPGEESGFSDWKLAAPGQFAVKWTSAEQLALISETFQDIHWHTTWIQPAYGKERFVERFTEWFDFGPHPVLVDQLETEAGRPHWGDKPSPGDQWLVAPGYTLAVPIEVVPEPLWVPLHEAFWWKLNAVAALLATDRLPGKIVWVDDDIPTSRQEVFEVLRYFDAVDRFRLVAPRDVFTRTQIEEAAEWLQS